MFSINSLTGYSIITRNVWLVYSQPAIFRSTEDSNIPGSIEVSMQTKSTLNTLKRIAFAISLVDMSTVRTFLTGISRINGNNRFINCFSFVKHMITKYHGLSKGFLILLTPLISFIISTTLRGTKCSHFSSFNILRLISVPE